MIWFILLLYFMIGFFIGYRTHRLNSLLKTKKIERNARELAGLYADKFNENEKLKLALNQIGPWMSAAMEDPSVCTEMKADIVFMFETIGTKKD